MEKDRFVWSPNADSDEKFTFTLSSELPSGCRTYEGRAAATKAQQEILAARWLRMMDELRKSSRLITSELVREAWFACIGVPTAEERWTVERARTIVASHIGTDTLAQIYREAA